MLNAFSCFFGRMGSGKKIDPMDFMDEYAEVMNKYAEVEVYNGFKRGYKGLSIAYSFTSRDMLWLEDGVYCFDQEERGKVRRGGVFNSPSIDLTQKVMLNYTVSILRHALGFERLGLPIEEDELPSGWSMERNRYLEYVSLKGPDDVKLEFNTGEARYCVPLAWLYDVSPSELLHAYMLPYGGPLLRRWLGRPYLR